MRSWLGPNLIWLVSFQEEQRHTEKTGMWKWGQRLEWCFHVPGSTWDHQRLEEEGKDPSPEATEGNWPCWHPDLGLSSSKTLRKQRSVVLSQPLYGVLTAALGNKHSLCLGWLCPPVHHHIALLVNTCQFSSVAQLCPTLQPHGLQHARLPCATPPPRDCSDLCPLSWLCHPTILSLTSPSPPAFKFPSLRVFSNGSVFHIRWSKS